MRMLIKLLLIAVIASSSAFFILLKNTEVVEAKACPMGTFPQLTKWTSATDFTINCKDPIIYKNGVRADNIDQQMSKIKSYIMFFLKMLTVVASAVVSLTITMAGYNYIMAAGDTKKIEQAKLWLMRGAIGTLFIFSSFIVMGVLRAANGF